MSETISTSRTRGSEIASTITGHNENMNSNIQNKIMTARKKSNPNKVKVSKKKLTWIAALNKWNKGKAGWTIPKKGTSAYDEVRALMK